MGVVSKIVSSVSKLFGGSSDSGGTVEVSTGAVSAAPEGEGAQKEENVDSTVQKKRRGKRSLIVDSSNNTTATRNTGLNI